MKFQCSSASRKFLNLAERRHDAVHQPGFSALQRAENSSTPRAEAVVGQARRFSALQRAENSSTWRWRRTREGRRRSVSVLFSEPKIPQPGGSTMPRASRDEVSVLFSEPKIPQQANTSIANEAACTVSVLFSEPKIPQLTQAISPTLHQEIAEFQCSSASRKFLNLSSATGDWTAWPVSVLFSEPKIPQPRRRGC